MGKPLVSICCLVYNHEPFLRECFEGFVMQKTTFPIEVLVHDDASTDHSVDIIREYTEKYPDIFKPIFESENLYSKRDNSLSKVISVAIEKTKCKYIAYCEGDDFWTDPLKLQKQIDALEQHSDCVLSVHTNKKIDKTGTSYLGTIPNRTFNHNIITAEEYIAKEMSDCWASQAASYVFKADIFFDIVKENPPFVTYANPSAIGDTPLVFYALTKGNVYFFQEEMACYRVLSGGYCTQAAQDNNKKAEFLFNTIRFLTEYNKYTIYKYNKYIIPYLDNMKYDLYLLIGNYLKMMRCKKYADNSLKNKYTLLKHCIKMKFTPKMRTVSPDLIMKIHKHL